jgi:uncharacterized protein YkwD
MATRGVSGALFLGVLIGLFPGTAAAVVSDLEQYMLELINQARADPQSEADSHLSGNLNEGLEPGTISTTTKQPLVFDVSLDTAAGGHTEDMVSNDFFSHTGTGGSTFADRITNAGYPFSGSFGSGENIATRSNFSADVTASTILSMYTDLFIDSLTPSRGHRLNLMNASFESIGLGAGHSSAFSLLSSLPSDVVTQDFAYTSAQGPYLTGVAYDDGDVDNFYTPGEGLGGLAVTAFLAGTSTTAASTTTLGSGGYALQLSSGSYDLQIVGPLGTLFEKDISLGSQNLKFDYNNSTAVDLADPPVDPAESVTDTDGDGMGDSFENRFGLNPNDPSDATLDNDGDGASNLEEFERHRNPRVNEHTVIQGIHPILF